MQSGMCGQSRGGEVHMRKGKKEGASRPCHHFSQWLTVTAYFPNTEIIFL